MNSAFSTADDLHDAAWRRWAALRGSSSFINRVHNAVSSSYGKFIISGCIGTLLFYWLFLVLTLYLPSAASYTAAYAISILWQHALHRFFVWGTESNYWQTLVATYFAYSVSILSSPFIYYFLDTSLLQKQAPTVAWCMTLAATGIINYFMLNFAFRSASNAQAVVVYDDADDKEKSDAVGGVEAVPQQEQVRSRHH